MTAQQAEIVDSVGLEGILALGASFPLFHGGGLADAGLAWRLEGPDGAPVIVALGGISAHRRVFDADGLRRGWWSDLVGPGRAIDASQYRILGIDYLGGSGASTGPGAGQRNFPSISSRDQAAALHALAGHLGIARWHAIVGASYGAMVALAYAERWPEGVERLLVISGAHRPHPLSTAWRSVQRAAVRQSLERGDGKAGLTLARALAMATYRTGREFEQRFGGEPRRDESGRFVFPVEDYLYARGDDYAQRYRPEAFVCLSESIDLHRVDPARVTVPADIIAIAEDQLVPIADMQSLAAGYGGPAQLHVLSSLYGHDAFLKEIDALAPLCRAALARRSSP